MRKIAFFFFLLVIGGAMSSCSRDTTSIKYNKSGLPILDDRHLVAYVAAREEVGKRCFHHFVNHAAVRMSLFVFRQKSFFEGRRGSWKLKADIIIGGTVDAHQMMKQKPIYSCYEPACEPYFKTVKDKDGYWYGYEVEKLAIAINKERWNEEIAPLGLPYPSRWQDLLNPVYKEKVVMPDPNVSGTAYTFFNH